MSNINERKKALLEHKRKILEEIQYCDKSIEDFRANYKNNRYYDDVDSSDSEDFFPDAVESGPEISELKLQQAMLKTCLQATQELTGLTILQSEVNILVQEPELNGESPITEAGTWREVLSECKVDLVAFTITFFAHTGVSISLKNRKFAPTLYRGLQLQLVKACHEMELSNSVLHTLRRPSDAVEVIRSYAEAYRSRRTTLAHLANKYSNTLFMEPHPEGGFVLKCANLLEILWRLENKWSSVAPFHHRMKFDVEYMDEAYIKIITQAHKQLLDPSIQTDERTLLLSKIIATCLEARGPMDSESDLESVGIKSRQNEMQPEEPKDNEVMAPPKSLPKKGKNSAAKDKDTSEDTKTAQKRALENDKNEGNPKKAKTNEVDSVKRNFTSKEKSGNSKNNKESNNDNKVDKPLKPDQSNKVKKSSKSKEKSDLKKSGNKKNNNDPTVDEEIKKKSNDKPGAIKRSAEKVNDIDDDNTKIKNNENVPTKKKNEDDIQANIVETHNIVEQPEHDDHNDMINHDNETQRKPSKTVANSNKNDKRIKNPNKQLKSMKESNKPKDNEELDVIINTDIIETNKNNVPTKKVDKKAKTVATNDKKFDVVTKKKTNKENKDSNNDNVNKETTKEAASNNVINTAKNIVTNTKDIDPQKTKSIEKRSVSNIKNTQQFITKPTESIKKKMTNMQTVKTFTERNANVLKNKDKVASFHKQLINNIKNKQTDTKNDEIASNNKNKLSKVTTKTVRSIIHKSPAHKNLLKLQNSQKLGNTKIIGNSKPISGNTEKENSGLTSKIPQKKVSTDSEINFKKNMLRISPRKLPSKIKTISQDNAKYVTKSTNIPRLMKKPLPKISK